MGFFGFGKRVKNQRFDYIPRYYDPAKDRLQERLKMASDEATPELTKMRIKDGFKRKSRGNKELERSIKLKSNIRLMIIIAMLILITYYLLSSDGIANFIQSMESFPSAEE